MLQGPWDTHAGSPVIVSPCCGPQPNHPAVLMKPSSLTVGSQGHPHRVLYPCPHLEVRSWGNQCGVPRSPPPLIVGSPTDPCGRSVGHFTPICMFPTRSMWGFPKYCPTFLWSPAPTSAESGMPCIYQTFPPPTWPQQPQACSPMQRAHLQFPSATSSCAANTVMVSVSHKAPGIVQFSQLPLTLSRHNPRS